MAEAKRFYKPEEKLRIALEGLSGTIQISELCRKYDIKPARFYHWKEKLLQSSQMFDDLGRKPCYGSAFVQTTRAWRNTYIGG